MIIASSFNWPRAHQHSGWLLIPTDLKAPGLKTQINLIPDCPHCGIRNTRNAHSQAQISGGWRPHPVATRSPISQTLMDLLILNTRNCSLLTSNGTAFFILMTWSVYPWVGGINELTVRHSKRANMSDECLWDCYNLVSPWSWSTLPTVILRPPHISCLLPPISDIYCKFYLMPHLCHVLPTLKEFYKP